MYLTAAFVVANEAVQLAVEPPLLPAQLHAQGPLPVTLDEVPAVHRLVVGTLARLSPLDAPQMPLTAVDIEVVVKLLRLDSALEEPSYANAINQYVALAAKPVRVTV